VKNIKGVIFDFDGTLLDSMQVWRHFEIEYLKSLGATPRPGLMEVLRALSSIEEAEYFKSEYGVSQSVEEIVLGRNALIGEKYRSEIPLKNGALEVLEALRERGVKMCIATATERELAQPVARRFDLYKYIERLFTCEEVGAGKSSPDIYLQAAGHMGTDVPQTLVVEDALYAMKTAKAAGFMVGGIYDLSSADQEEEIRAICDYYWMSFDDMLQMLLGSRVEIA